MKSVARRVTLSLCETKRFAIINELLTPLPINGSTSQWFYRSVFTPLGGGYTSFTIVGNEIVAPLLKVKFYFGVPWHRLVGNTNGYQDRYEAVGLNFMLIATNDQDVTSGVVRNYPNTVYDIDNWFYNDNGIQPTLNGNNVKVLKKWHKTVNPEVLGQNEGPPYGVKLYNGRLSYRWKRKLTFEDVPGAPPGTGGPQRDAILRGWNYYLLVGYKVNSLSPTVSTYSNPFCIADSFLYYKDP